MTEASSQGVREDGGINKQDTLRLSYFQEIPETPSLDLIKSSEFRILICMYCTRGQKLNFFHKSGPELELKCYCMAGFEVGQYLLLIGKGGRERSERAIGTCQGRLRGRLL